MLARKNKMIVNLALTSIHREWENIAHIPESAQFLFVKGQNGC